MTPDGCENFSDNYFGLNCSFLLENGGICMDLFKLKFCDRACNLCECSTGTGSIREHCSGHGTCQADCTQHPCTNAKCQCYPGWSGDVCQTRKYTISYVQNLEITS